MSEAGANESSEPCVGSAEWCQWRLDRNEDCIRQFRAECAAATGALFGPSAPDLRVSPGLVRPGEKVTITCLAAGDVPPSGEAGVLADYLASSEPEQPLVLDWQPRPGGGWLAVHELYPTTPGNWRVRWQSRAERITRVFGVAEPGRLVVTLWVGSNIPRLDEELHRYELPGDTWIGDWWSPFDRPLAQVVEDVKGFALSRMRYGDRLVPIVNAGFILPGIRDMNLFHLPAHVQARGLRQVREVWELLGFGPMELLASYTPGHVTGDLLAGIGVKALTSLCIWQNIQDGKGEKAWRINHVGAPNAPYYMARDDFRKVADGQSPLLGFSMGTSSDVRCYDFIAFDGCPTNCVPSQRYAPNNAIEANAYRFFSVADGWLHDARNHPDLLFVTVALENFRRSEHWRAANRQAADYLVRRAAEGRVVFASAADIADFYQRHYPRQPAQIHVWADGYAGLRHGDKPACLPDRIEMSCDRFHSLHREAGILPQLLWDYTVPWNNPEWDERTDVRQYNHGYGIVPPERIACTVAPDASCPREADLRDVRVEETRAPTPDGVEVRLRIATPRVLNDVPLALWGLPLEQIQNASVKVSGGMAARLVPVMDGWTGNPHALLILSAVPVSGGEVTVTVCGAERAPVKMVFSLDDRIGLRTFRTIEGPRTYFWRLDGAGPCRLVLRVPPGVRAAVLENDGRTVSPAADGRIEVEAGGAWPHESPCLVGAETVLTGGPVEVALLDPASSTGGL